MKTEMNWYFTQIQWIDPNGHGIISEYHYKACELKKARKKAEETFWKHAKQLYGEFWHEPEIRQINTEKIVAGLHNQRKWRNPK